MVIEYPDILKCFVMKKITNEILCDYFEIYFKDT